VETSVFHAEHAEVVVEVHCGDEKLFAELATLHEHYYNRRRDHLGEPIIDGSPAYINYSASTDAIISI